MNRPLSANHWREFFCATKNGLAVMNLKLEILDMTQLHTVKQRLQKVKGVQDIRRVLPGDRG